MSKPSGLRSGIALLAGGLFLWLVDQALDPVPVSAGPAFALGLLAWLSRRPH